MNEYMVDFFRRSAAQGTPAFHQIHGAGRDFAQMEQALKGIDLPPELQLREYIYDMPTVMQAADLVLCRGGASTLSELTAIGKPAVIVPSPNVLAQQGGAVVLLEPVCSGEVLYKTVSGLLSDPARLTGMSQAMTAMGVPDAAERIYDTLLTLLREN